VLATKGLRDMPRTANLSRWIKTQQKLRSFGLRVAVLGFQNKFYVQTGALLQRE
jgi:hypothetical protein